MVVMIVRLLRVLLQKVQAVVVELATVVCEVWRLICQLCDNARYFVLKYPPIVVFVLCIIFFMCLLLSLAHYVHINNDIRNPDVSKDWNMFVEQFSRLELCILQHNVTLDIFPVELPSSPTAKPKRADHRLNKSQRPAVAPKPPTETTELHTMSMLLAIQPTREFLSVKHSVSILSASIYGKYIGVKGISGTQRLNVTMVIPFDWEPDLCSSEFAACKTVYVNACVEFVGPKNLFPHSRHPAPCSVTKYAGVEYRAGLNWQMPDVDSFIFCRHRSMIRVQYQPNPQFTVRLTKEQRTVIKLRLLRVTYFMSVFVVLVIGWAFVFNVSRRRTSSIGEVVSL